jgi:hypothetical protein
MSNIQAPRGLNVSNALQSANSKQDGGGNGSGGMYFGQEEPYPQEDDTFMHSTEVDLDDIVYNVPFFTSIAEKLRPLKEALANILYQSLKQD